MALRVSVLGEVIVVAEGFFDEFRVVYEETGMMRDFVMICVIFSIIFWIISFITSSIDSP